MTDVQVQIKEVFRRNLVRVLSCGILDPYHLELDTSLSKRRKKAFLTRTLVHDGSSATKESDVGSKLLHQHFSERQLPFCTSTYSNDDGAVDHP